MVHEHVGDDSYKYYLLKGTDTATGQNVGLFTRVDPVINLQRTAERIDYPVPGSTCGTSTGDSGVSKHFFTRFEVENLDKPLVVIGAHFLAFPDDKLRCLQREAQATVLRDLGQKEARDNGYHLAMMGDFNDFDPTFLDAAGDVPISQVLEILKSDKSGKQVMLNAMSEIPSQANRWSCWYDKNSDCKHVTGEHTLIDHVLVDQGLASLISEARVALDAYAPTCGSYYSDHWPALVTFAL